MFEFDPEKLVGLSAIDFRAPDLTEAVEGWRAWKVKAEPPAFGTAPKLYSATWDYYWAPRVKARAQCGRVRAKEADHVPGEECSCGFYSAKTLEHLRSMGYHRYDADTGNVCVIGQLANWGKVIEGTQGWRAEFAYPVALYLPFEAFKLAEPLQKAYGVPVRLLNLLNDGSVPDPC